MSAFFEVQFDASNFPDRWHLDNPIDEGGNLLDASMFPRRGPYTGPEISKVQVNTSYPGRALDFSFGYFDFLIVRSHVAELIVAHGGNIQRFPVTLEPPQESGYEVIFTLDAPKGTIDLSRAEEFEFFDVDDTRVQLPYGGIAPRQKGMLYKVYDLYIHAERARGLTIFRPWEYASLIISGDLKRAFEAAEVTGISYRLVS